MKFLMGFLIALCATSFAFAKNSEQLFIDRGCSDASKAVIALAAGATLNGLANSQDRSEIFNSVVLMNVKLIKHTPNGTNPSDDPDARFDDTFTADFSAENVESIRGCLYIEATRGGCFIRRLSSSN